MPIANLYISSTRVYPGNTVGISFDSNAYPITAILTADKVALPKEFTGMYWSGVAIFACSDDNEEDMLVQGSVSQAVTGTFALGVVYDSSNSQVALGDANARVDAVFKKKQ